MTSENAVLGAFAEWVKRETSIDWYEPLSRYNVECAFIAGAEWQRERDACVVLQYYCGYDGVATKHGHHYVGPMENVAEHVRSGEGKDWGTINSTVGGHA